MVEWLRVTVESNGSEKKRCGSDVISSDYMVDKNELELRWGQE